MTTSLLQVLVPVRDGAPYLAAAIDSLCAQSHVEWQALLCPLDASAHDAASHCVGNDAKFQVAATVGMAEADALALAADKSDAGFICVLDGDDVLEPTAFATLLEALHADPATGMAYSRHVLIDANGRVLGPGPLCDLPYSPTALLMDFITGPLRIMRMSAYRKAGGHLGAHPDAIEYDLCLRLSESAGVVHVAQPLYRRRIHPRAPDVARWAEGIQARYEAFVAAVKRRGLDADYECALEIDSWHILQPLRPFGGVGNWR